jgi:putative CRISPR-associated protein (TIGR02620 family)
MVVVTRHKGTIEYLKQMGVIREDCTVVEHATADDVRGKDVVGVLPMNLAALARSVTVVDLDVPFDLRGIELSREQVQQYATGIHTYTVKEKI